MRIIAGSMRGRRLSAPPGTGTRPTTDRVRESLFSSLASIAGPDLGGGPVLDAFAGSGALGLEAVSRGAGPVVLVEKDRRAQATIRSNIESLGCGQRAALRAGDAFTLAKRGMSGGPFALILLDPPYTLDAAKVGGLVRDLAEGGAVARGAIVSWEHAADAQPMWPSGFSVVSRKRYGTTGIDIAVYGDEEGS
jgi:16S rRNA (guanine966-N2)-methyltransferase